MFGQQTRAPFGSTPSTFGFGTPSTTAPSTGFGSTTFGRPAFGAPQQTTSFGTGSTPFGAATSSGTSLFGSQPQQTGGGLFGQQTQASTGFSQPSTGFGSTSGGGLFGQTQQPGTGLFGSGSTGGFGTQQSTQNRPFGFGQTTTTSTTTSGGLFGSTPSTAGGLFGASTGFGTGGGAVTGTTVKYEPVTGSDTMTRNGVSSNIRTRIEVITTMKEYENKSLEELRVEDYLANRKGPGQGTTLPGFGQTQTQPQQPQAVGSTGLFGTSTGTSLFGSKPPENKSLFGTGTSSGFGSTSGGSLFGTNTSAPAFGQPSTTANTGFSFTQNTQQKSGGFTFGNTATTTPSLFGSTSQQPQPAFGLGFHLGQNTQQQNTGGLFGNQNKTGGGFLSTQNTGGGLFGSKPAGITQPISTGFGTSSTASPFGTATNTNTGTGLFGTQNNQNKAGLFSNFGNNTGFGNTGLFGQNNNQQKPGGLSFGTFGSNNTMGQGLGAPTGGGLFNTTPANTSIGSTGLFNTNPGFMGQTSTMTGGGGGIYPDLGKLVRAMTEKPIFDIPVGGSKLSSATEKSSGSSPSDQSSKPAISSLKPTYVLSPSLVANNKPRPKPVNKTNNQGNNRHWLFKGLEDPNEESSEDFLKPKKYPSVRKLNLKVFKTEESPPRLNGDLSGGDVLSPLTVPVSPMGDATPLRGSGPPSHDNSPTPDIIKGRGSVKRLTLTDKCRPADDTLADLNVNQLRVREEEEEEDPEYNKENKETNNSDNNVSLFNNSGDADDLPEMNKSSDQPHPTGIKCTRSGYYTLPSLEDLAEIMAEEGKCEPENFTIGRYGYGNVCFLGKTDVAGLDIDSTVFILRKQLEVYPEGTQKPPHGQQLNKPAIITLDCVWPVDKTTREVIKSSERLEAMGWSDYLERQCVKMEASFIEYRPETGSWVFKVRHFSKYGLQEDNDDEEMSAAGNKAQPPQPPTSTQPPPPPLRTTLGPPATALTSPPHFPLSHSSGSPKQVIDGMFLEGDLEEPKTPDDDYMDAAVAREPEESASMSVLSPSSERLTVASRVVPRTVQLAKSQLFAMDEEEEEEEETMDQGRPTREATPTPYGPRMSSKKLMLNTDVSLNQSRGATASPIPLQTVSEPRARVTLCPQPIHSPFRQAEEEPEGVVALRDPRSEYIVLPSGRSVGQESEHAAPQHLASIVPLPSSLMVGLHHCVADMGAFMGRSFRVGWGPGWVVNHTGPALASSSFEGDGEDKPGQVTPSPPAFLFMGSLASQPKTTPSADGPRYKVAMEKLHMVLPEPQTISAVTEASLECILEHSVLEMVRTDDPACCPFLRPAHSLDLLHQLADTADAHARRDMFGDAPLLRDSHTPTAMAEIMSLCVALWGHLGFYSPESDGETPYTISRARVEAVSQWLESVSETVVQKEVSAALKGEQVDEGYLDAIFSHLTARQISQACILAQDKGDHHLALLLAQACFGQEAPRLFLGQQLANWAEGGTDALMAPARLALYALLAGSPTHHASHTTVNTCIGLDWRRAFALHLWYVCPATSTLAEVLKEYEHAANLIGDMSGYCDPPFPPYMAKTTLPDGQKMSYDVCYHLMKLFTDPMHRLEALLNPATITPDPLDVTISWVLWRVLESLKYTHLSDHHQASLHLSMAALLESAGQWHWAVFVLLNIEDEDRRRAEVERVLLRHVEVESEGDDGENSEYTARQEFVVNRLAIPEKWIYQAKATKARSFGMVDEEAWFLLKAGDYNRAHLLILETIAPNSIINEDHDYLRGYLKEMCTGGAETHVIDWMVGGGVYADYLEVCSVVEDMKASGEPTPALLEQLRPRLLALCARLNNLRGTTATHRLCVSEMSRVVVGVLRAVVGDGTDATPVLSQKLSGLPLTHDYALAELNHFTTNYLTDFAAEP